MSGITGIRLLPTWMRKTTSGIFPEMYQDMTVHYQNLIPSGNDVQMKKICILVGVMLMVMIMLSMSIQKVTPYKEKLSQYGLFVGELHDQTPAGQVMFYELNAPLFSDYAYKLRFVRLPEGQHVEYNSDSVFQFPVGTVIAKTFFIIMMNVIQQKEENC